MHDDWSQAFAAMPQETPPARGWERLSARLDAAAAPARKARFHARAPAWIGLAVAASLVLVFTPWKQRDPEAAAGAAITPPASHREPVGAAEAAIANPPNPREPVGAAEAAIAASAAPTKPAPVKMRAAPLDALYAESAQLEALLAVARDDRVSSAGAALLADELDSQVAAVDASLARPDLDEAERLRLWRARVDALRQAAGFESTQRLLASQGRSDVMLVSVD